MIKNLCLSAALIFAGAITGCTQTESALTDDVDQSSAEQQTAQKNKSLSADKTPVNKIEVAPNDGLEGKSLKSDNTPAETDQMSADQKAPIPTQPTAKPASNRPETVQTPFPVKRCMNLGNALEATNEGDWGYKIRERDLKSIKLAGFDTVRLPVKWDAHTANRTPYAVDPSFTARVQTVIGQAHSAGLGVILDVHHFEKLMRHPKRQEARFLAIWTQISRTFKDYPANLYFEILNEPTLEINMAEVNALYAKTIPVIRATNPTRKIIMGGNSWNSVETLSKVQWPNDPNIVATFHDYGPHAFTHQGAEWSEPVMPIGRRWGGLEDANELKETYAIAKEFQTKTGLPILVGEFGVIDKVPLPERLRWIKIRRQTMEANNIAWCAWDFSGAFKTYDTNTKQWLPGVQDAFFGR